MGSCAPVWPRIALGNKKVLTPILVCGLPWLNAAARTMMVVVTSANGRGVEAPSTDSSRHRDTRTALSIQRVILPDSGFLPASRDVSERHAGGCRRVVR